MQKKQSSNNGNQVPRENSNSLQNSENGLTEDPRELAKVTPIDGTPFAVVKAEDKYFLVTGNYKVSKNFRSQAGALEDINNITWDKITAVAYTVANDIKNK